MCQRCLQKTNTFTLKATGTRRGPGSAQAGSSDADGERGGTRPAPADEGTAGTADGQDRAAAAGGRHDGGGADRTAYAPGTAGTKRWAEDTRSATDGFALSKRQRSTAIEHVNYMSGWSRLLEKQGFGKYAGVCGAEVKNCLSDGKRGLRPVMEKATKGARKKTPKVRDRDLGARERCDGGRVGRAATGSCDPRRATRAQGRRAGGSCRHCVG